MSTIFVSSGLAADGTSDPPPDSIASAPASQNPVTVERKPGIHWGPFLAEEFFFLDVENAFRLATEPKTRQNLSGPYFDDWFYIVQHIQWSRWSDGDKWFTSNIAHPAQGAVTAWIYRQNDDHARALVLDFHDPAYRNMLIKAFITATVAEFWFKIGPFSEATIGHVGLYTNPWTGTNRTGLNDYVLNEAVGVPIMIGEDWLDQHVTMRVENRTQSRAVIDTVRIFASPTRSLANLIAFHKPWRRDTRE